MPEYRKHRPYSEAPKDGTIFLAQYVGGLQFENRRTKYGGDHLGWLYEARPNEFDLAPSGWTFQWWFELSDEEQLTC